MPRKSYRYVYYVEKVHAPDLINLKEGDVIFWGNYGKEYTIQVIDTKNHRVVSAATIRLICILPDGSEEAKNFFLKVIKEICEKRQYVITEERMSGEA